MFEKVLEQIVLMKPGQGEETCKLRGEKEYAYRELVIFQRQLNQFGQIKNSRGYLPM